jgi:hypothetical protein
MKILCWVKMCLVVFFAGFIFGCGSGENKNPVSKITSAGLVNSTFKHPYWNQPGSLSNGTYAENNATMMTGYVVEPRLDNFGLYGVESPVNPSVLFQPPFANAIFAYDGYYDRYYFGSVRAISFGSGSFTTKEKIIAMVAGSGWLFVAEENGLIEVFDSINAQKVGELQTGYDIVTNNRIILVSGKLYILTDDSTGEVVLREIDISDPTTPLESGRLVPLAWPGLSEVEMHEYDGKILLKYNTRGQGLLVYSSLAVVDPFQNVLDIVGSYEGYNGTSTSYSILKLVTHGKYVFAVGGRIVNVNGYYAMENYDLLYFEKNNEGVPVLMEAKPMQIMAYSIFVNNFRSDGTFSVFVNGSPLQTSYWVCQIYDFKP